MKRLRIPAPEGPLLAIGKFAEAVVDNLAEFMYRVMTPMFQDLSEREKRALAYALVGDLIASPIPEPFDAPIDVVVQEKLRDLLPEMNKYLRTAARIAEWIPVLELLPNYTMAVMATIRERQIE